MNCKATNQNIEKPLYGLENQLFRIRIVHEVLFLQIWYAIDLLKESLPY